MCLRRARTTSQARSDYCDPLDFGANWQMMTNFTTNSRSSQSPPPQPKALEYGLIGLSGIPNKPRQIVQV